MNTKRILIPYITAMLILTLLTSYVAQNRKTQDSGDNSMDQRQPAQPDAEPDKESAIKSRLADLLIDQGLRLTEASLNPKSGTYREAKLRWETTAAASDTLEKPSGLFQRVGLSASRKGDLPRQRSLELSIEQLVVIGVGEDSQILWWHTLADPRLVRAETPDETGKLKNESFYLPTVEFAIAYPEDLGIRALRLYHPVWNGKDFQLQLAGTLPVAD